ncbi:spermine oxidase-like [Coccinella septempunctata]|uniref:spermine oxidase-like n=1 Tax=Coccinella septempunctata TaxID=41139 RepID=UPI001D06A02D|nr:spermine oxidase-like [Coccinella septempunctata]
MMSKMWFCVFVCLFGCASAAKVIIIGAGASGIATASRLLEQNITDFIILEAENRIGGRIHSFYLSDGFVDLGAQFVHGERGNIAYTLAKDYVVHNPEMNEVAVYFEGTKKTGENLQSIGKQLYYEVSEHAPYENLSIGDVYLSRYNTTVLTKYKDDPEMTSYANFLLKNLEAAVLALEGAFDWFKVSAQSSFHEADGDQTLSWNGLGYKTILDILLKNFPNQTGYNINDKIFLGKSVNKIALKETSVEVTCKDGSVYTSDHVVFTPSLGVLKNRHKDIFQPELSPEKVNAIENLGFDGIMKIILEFPQAWWKKERNFLFVWNDKDIEDLKRDIPFGPKTDDDHWLSWFGYFGIAPNNPHVMIGWYSGPFVEEVEKLSEDQIGKAVFYTLQKHLGRDYNVTKPRTVIHSKWRTNPNFRGTYSYETVQLRMKNITSAHEKLSEPVEGGDGKQRILFAGEATHPSRFSTVDGAIGSGFREGDRLVNMLK